MRRTLASAHNRGVAVVADLVAADLRLRQPLDLDAPGLVLNQQIVVDGLRRRQIERRR